eukprot:564057-Lingulodinium_polyedra.AAC.1
MLDHPPADMDMLKLPSGQAWAAAVPRGLTGEPHFSWERWDAIIRALPSLTKQAMEKVYRTAFYLDKLWAGRA